MSPPPAHLSAPPHIAALSPPSKVDAPYPQRLPPPAASLSLPSRAQRLPGHAGSRQGWLSAAPPPAQGTLPAAELPVPPHPRRPGRSPRASRAHAGCSENQGRPEAQPQRPAGPPHSGEAGAVAGVWPQPVLHQGFRRKWEDTSQRWADVEEAPGEVPPGATRPRRATHSGQDRFLCSMPKNRATGKALVLGSAH